MQVQDGRRLTLETLESHYKSKRYAVPSLLPSAFTHGAGGVLLPMLQECLIGMILFAQVYVTIK